MEKLVIVMTTDENYIVPTKVAIFSMLNSTPDVWFEIHILCDRNLDADGRSELCALADKLKRVKLVFDEVQDTDLNDAKTLGHIPIASYYRLYIAKMINEDRCLFLDGDIIVNADLREIYWTDLNGYYVAGVRDCAVQSKNLAFANHELELNIPNMCQYVNAGVMLFNLELIRKDCLDQQFICAIKNGYKYMDQDILNKYCYDRIKHFPLRFNLFAEFYDRLDKMGECDYSQEELQKVEQWGILHYPGSFKPWVCSRLKANQIWWKMARNVLSEDEYLKWWSGAKEQERLSDWTYILENVDTDRKVVIFGFSEVGFKVEAQLRDSVPEIAVEFADNDIKKQGLLHEGKTVLSAEEAVAYNQTSLWIIISHVAHDAIRKQLRHLGIESDKIIRYIYKPDAYYEGLDDANYEYEMRILRNDR